MSLDTSESTPTAEKHDTTNNDTRAYNDLAEESWHTDHATRFVYHALAYVVHHHVPIAGWDENDYAYIAEIAKALDNNSLLLEQLIWKEGKVWRRDGALVVSAVSAFVADEEIRAAGDEDAESDAANDYAYLCTILRPENPGNVFANDTSA